MGVRGPRTAAEPPSSLLLPGSTRDDRNWLPNFSNFCDRLRRDLSHPGAVQAVKGTLATVTLDPPAVWFVAFRRCGPAARAGRAAAPVPRPAALKGTLETLNALKGTLRTLNVPRG